MREIYLAPMHHNAFDRNGWNDVHAVLRDYKLCIDLRTD